MLCASACHLIKLCLLQGQKGDLLKRPNSSTKKQTRGHKMLTKPSTCLYKDNKKLCAQFRLQVVAARTPLLLTVSKLRQTVQDQDIICTNTRKLRHNPASCRAWWSLTNQDDGKVCGDECHQSKADNWHIADTHRSEMVLHVFIYLLFLGRTGFQLTRKIMQRFIYTFMRYPWMYYLYLVTVSINE